MKNLSGLIPVGMSTCDAVVIEWLKLPCIEHKLYTCYCSHYLLVYLTVFSKIVFLFRFNRSEGAYFLRYSCKSDL